MTEKSYPTPEEALAAYKPDNTAAQVSSGIMLPHMTHDFRAEFYTRAIHDDNNSALTQNVSRINVEFVDKIIEVRIRDVVDGSVMRTLHNLKKYGVSTISIAMQPDDDGIVYNYAIKRLISHKLAHDYGVADCLEHDVIYEFTHFRIKK